MDLDLRQLRYFLAVVDHGTYSAASRVLHVATPSLSQQIRKLESDLGVRLLDRDHRGARPTTVGRDLVEHARALLATQDRAMAVVRRHVRSVGGTLRLGFLSGVAGPRTRPILDLLHARAPDSEIELVQVGWGDQVDAVLDGRVDAVFARPPLPEAPVRRTSVLTEPRVLAMAVDHPLAGSRDLEVADLAGVVQVDAQGVDEAWRRWWSLDPRPDGSSPRYGPVVHSIEELLQVVATSPVVAVTAASVADLHPRPDVTYRVLTDVEPTTIELITAPGPPSPLVGLLLAAVRAHRLDGLRD